MQANNLRPLFVWPVAVTLLLSAPHASADDADPAAIETRLKALETSEANRALLAEPLANARKVIKRVLDARAAGDAAHAVELAALADDWAKLAANVVRASEVERELATQQAKLLELEQKRRRTETLLEATIAQRERTRQELSRLRAGQARAKGHTDGETSKGSSMGSRSGAPVGAKTIGTVDATSSPNAGRETAAPAGAKATSKESKKP